MEDRGGASPLNNQVPSDDAQAAQQVTSNQHAGYDQEMEVDSQSVPGQSVEASTNSASHSHPHVENHVQASANFFMSCHLTPQNNHFANSNLNRDEESAQSVLASN